MIRLPSFFYHRHPILVRAAIDAGIVVVVTVLVMTAWAAGRNGGLGVLIVIGVVYLGREWRAAVKRVREQTAEAEGED